MTNGVTIDLNVLGILMEGRVIQKENDETTAARLTPCFGTMWNKRAIVFYNDESFCFFSSSFFFFFFGVCGGGGNSFIDGKTLEGENYIIAMKAYIHLQNF